MLMSKTEVKLLYCGPVHRSLDSQHVQLLLQASSANTTNIVPTKLLCPIYLFQISMEYQALYSIMNIFHKQLDSTVDSIIVETFTAHFNSNLMH